MSEVVFGGRSKTSAILNEIKCEHDDNQNFISTLNSFAFKYNLFCPGNTQYKAVKKQFEHLLCCIALVTTAGVFRRKSKSFKILSDSDSSTFRNHKSLSGICPLLFDVSTALRTYVNIIIFVSCMTVSPTNC